MREPHLLVTPIEVGGDIGFRVAFGTVGSTVWLYSGTRRGPGPCRPVLQGGCFGIVNPMLVGSGQIGPDGTLHLTTPTPAGVVAGERRAFQAVVDGSPPVLTDVVTRTAEASVPQPLGSNVLIVLFDDLGTDKLAGWGSTNPAPTPTLDSLAAAGVSFDNAYTRPVCGPARAGIQTGRYSRRTGVGSNWNESQPWELGPEQITLAELVELSPHFEYQTSLAGKWHLGSPSGPHGLALPEVQGWDWYAGSYMNLFRVGSGYQSYFGWTKVVSGAFQYTTTYATTDTIDDAITRLGTMSEPWLMFVSLNTPHAPFEEPPAALMPVVPDPGDGLAMRKMIAAADTELARLLAAVPPAVRARTTLVVTSDNGTPQAEVQDPVHPFRGKGTMFDGGSRVPMIVAGAGVGAPGTRSSAFVDIVDIYATVADIVGVDVTEVSSALDAAAPYEIDGFSLLPLLQDPTLPGPRTYAYSEVFGPPGGGPYFEYDRQMIRDQRFKLIVDNNAGTHRLYEYLPGAPDEGDDLLGCGDPLSPEQQAAYDRLLAALQNRTARVGYDAEPFVPRVGPDPGQWPEDTAVPVCSDTGSDTGAGDTGISDTGTGASDTGGP